eukprot:2979964-Alexandrium_andersonii.AAC.1
MERRARGARTPGACGDHPTGGPRRAGAIALAVGGRGPQPPTDGQSRFRNQALLRTSPSRS